MITKEEKHFPELILTAPDWLKNSPSTSLPILLVAFYIVFPQKFITIITTILVKPLFESVSKSSYLLDGLLIITVVYILLRYILAATIGKRLSLIEYFWIISYTVIYIGIRFFSSDTFFYTKFSIPGLSIMDLLDVTLAPALGLTVYSTILSTKRKPKRPENPEPNLYLDDPIILDKDNDPFDRRSHISKLASIIKSAPNTIQSFAIGITGRWGSGKTTLLNTLFDQLKGDKSIIQLNFNPWLTNSTENLTKSFFKTLAVRLSNYDANLKRQILQYEKQLLASLDSPSLATIKSISSLLFDTNSDLIDLHDQISKSLERLDRKLVVYIDDIDRLTKDEIFEILRTIRNTANFANTIFVVAYDKPYILVNTSLSQSYLEKIFQLEVAMPLFPVKLQYRERLFKELKKIIIPEHQNILDNISNPGNLDTFFVGEILPPLTSYITSFRDINRFMNIFILSYDKIKNNIYFPDYLASILFRLKYYEVYKLLYLNKYSFLGPIADRQFFEVASGMMHLKKTENGSIKPSDSILYSYLSNRLSEYGLTSDELNSAIELANAIFGMQPVQSGLHSERRTMDKNYLSIAYVSNFDRYFDFLLEGRLDEESFVQVLKEPIDRIKQQFDEWNNDNALGPDLQIKLENIKHFQNFDFFKKIILAIVHFANLPIAKNPSFRNSFSFDNFNKKFKYHLKNTSKEEVVHFFATLFSRENTHDKWGYIHDFCSFILENGLKDAPVEPNELVQLAVASLNDTLSESTDYDPDLIKFFNQTTKLTSMITRTQSIVYGLDAARKKVKDLIKNNLRKFLESIIIRENAFGRVTLDIYTIQSIFTDVNAFEEFTESLNDAEPWFKEFQKFWDAYFDPANGAHRKPFDFTFQHLTP